MKINTPPLFNPLETYTISEHGLIIRQSDGAQIPEDSSNSDYREFLAWQANGGVISSYVAPFNPDNVKLECRRRIFNVASDTAQKNMLAAIAVGNMSTKDKAVFKTGVNWIADMQFKSRELIASQDTTYTDDIHWPIIPDGIVELVAKY